MQIPLRFVTQHLHLLFNSQSSSQSMHSSCPFTYRQLNLSALNCISISARFLYPVSCLPSPPSSPTLTLPDCVRVCEGARGVCAQIIRQEASSCLPRVNYVPKLPLTDIPFGLVSYCVPCPLSLSLSCLRKYASEYENNTVNNVK